MSAQREDLSDADLMSRVAQGAGDAIGDLYMRHSEAVACALRAMSPALPRADIQDLCQEVFLSLYDAADRYEERGQLRRWLIGIARRKLWRWRLRLTRRKRLFTQHMPTPPEVPTSEALVGANHALESVLRAMSRLPEGQRQVLLLHVVAGLSGEAIAESLGISPKTVWTRLHRARAALAAAVPDGEVR